MGATIKHMFTIFNLMIGIKRNSDLFVNPVFHVKHRMLLFSLAKKDRRRPSAAFFLSEISR